MLTAAARPPAQVWRSPPADGGSAMLYYLPESPRTLRVPLHRREAEGVYYRRRPGMRLIMAALGSLLIHAGLAVFIGKSLLVAEPEIPRPIKLRFDMRKTPSPGVEPAPPLPSPPTADSPPAPALERSPVAKSPPTVRSPEPKPKPQPISRPKRERPELLKTPPPVTQSPPRLERKRPKLKTQPSVAQSPPRLERKRSKLKAQPSAAQSPLHLPQTASGVRPPPVANTSVPLPSSSTSTIEESPLLLNPRYRRPPSPPVYPPRAVRFGHQGTVFVRARISATGDVIEVHVHQSSGHSLLDDAALAAVRHWAFVPATRNGVSLEAWVRVPVNFVLTENRRSLP